MRIQNEQHVLAFWEEIYGALEEKWKSRFMNHKCMRSILNHNSDNIKVAIRRNKNLSDVLNDLENQKLNKEIFKRKVNPYRDSIPDEPQSKVERRERDGGRWGRQF
jgi:hypothetical protein